MTVIHDCSHNAFLTKVETWAGAMFEGCSSQSLTLQFDGVVLFCYNIIMHVLKTKNE